MLNNDEVGSLYTINENSDGKIDKWGYTRKEYNLEVTPKLNGKTGSSYTVSFTIGEGTGGSEPTVSITSPANGAKSVASDDLVFLEENGLVVMEAESLKLPPGWSEEKKIQGYMGDGYMVDAAKVTCVAPATRS